MVEGSKSRAAFLGSLDELATQILVLKYAYHGAGERLWIAGGGQEAGGTTAEEFRKGAFGTRHRRSSCGHGLGYNSAEAFVA